MGCLKLTYRETYTALKVVRGGLYLSEKGCADAYRYGFNGMEISNEYISNVYTTEFREYDSRLGRFTSIDKFASKAPGWNPYRFGFDNPIIYLDPSGTYEIKAEASKEEKKDIRRSVRKDKSIKRSDRSDEIKKREGELVEQKKEKIREIVNNTKLYLDQNPDIRKKFENFNNIKKGSKEWENTFSENGSGPIYTTETNKSYGGSWITGKNTMKFNMDNSKSLASKMRVFMHESSHMCDDLYNGGKGETKGGRPLPDYTSDQQLAATQDALDHYYSLGNNVKSDYKSWIKVDKDGNIIVTGVELGYAWDRYAFGEDILTSDPEKIIRIKDSEEILLDKSIERPFLKR